MADFAPTDKTLMARKRSSTLSAIWGLLADAVYPGLGSRGWRYEIYLQARGRSWYWGERSEGRL